MTVHGLRSSAPPTNRHDRFATVVSALVTFTRIRYSFCRNAMKPFFASPLSCFSAFLCSLSGRMRPLRSRSISARATLPLW